MPEAGLNYSRAYADPLADSLPPLVLDRQRIVHSAAFRRLLQKTQVFVAVGDDHFRRRMTHTLEVAHLARCLAQQLGLCADLAEVVALAHDLGHPPFGHAGEKALQACLYTHGGFEHNQHTLRLIEELEHPYPDFHGLNLTRAVRECLAKHSTEYDQPGPHPLQDGQPPPAEGIVVALADQMAYGLHDLQDAIYANLFKPGKLNEIEMWRAAYDGPTLEPGAAWRGHLRPTIDRMLLRLVADVVENTTTGNPTSVRLSDQSRMRLKQLGDFLFENVYRSEPLQRADAKAKRVVIDIFEAFVADPQQMPARYARRVGDWPVERVTADYVAGMTDRFCMQEHARLFDPQTEV
ncbi:MAG: dGTP triphosphohydrolase [Planctomycetota bacterium]